MPGRLGHGFGWIEVVGGKRRGPKGGLLQTSQAGAWFEEDGLCTVVVWNGQHTGSNLTMEGSDGAGWSPRFEKVLNAAAGASWPKPDLFPNHGMSPLATTQVDWRWCRKCEGLFYAGHGHHGTCPAGGGHDPTGTWPYAFAT